MKSFMKTPGRAIVIGVSVTDGRHLRKEKGKGMGNGVQRRHWQKDRIEEYEYPRDFIIEFF